MCWNESGCRWPRQPNSIVGAGRTKSTSRNTHQARPCINSPLEVKLSAKALLQLACWCRQRAADSSISASKHEQGGSTWQHVSPPAPSDQSAGSSDRCAARTIVDAASADAAAGSARATDADSSSAAVSSQQQGGGR